MKQFPTLTQQEAEQIYLTIKQEQMENLGYESEDLDDDSIEDEVNRNADMCFIDYYGETNLDLAKGII